MSQSKRLRPGLHRIETSAGTFTVERNDGQMGESHIRGWWYADTPSGNDSIEAPTLIAMRAEIDEVTR